MCSLWRSTTCRLKAFLHFQQRPEIICDWRFFHIENFGNSEVARSPIRHRKPQIWIFSRNSISQQLLLPFCIITLSKLARSTITVLVLVALYRIWFKYSVISRVRPIFVPHGRLMSDNIAQINFWFRTFGERYLLATNVAYVNILLRQPG